MSSSKKITLKSSDGEIFDVEEAVALASQSLIFKNLIDEVNVNDVVPLTNITGKTLAMVIEYCNKHHAAAAAAAAKDTKSAQDDLKSWDADFVKVDQKTLFDIMLAACYLNIASLMKLTCQTVADMIKDKTTEEVRAMLNIENDFTPEEEEKIKKENPWAFELKNNC